MFVPCNVAAYPCRRTENPNNTKSIMYFRVCVSFRFMYLEGQNQTLNFCVIFVYDFLCHLQNCHQGCCKHKISI